MELPPEVLAAELASRRAAPRDPEPLTAAELAEFDELTRRAQARELERLHRRTEAVLRLRRWASAYRDRDDVIRQAVADGVSVHEVHRITGLARTTIDRITSRG